MSQTVGYLFHINDFTIYPRQAQECRATFFSTAFGIIFNIRLAPTRLMHYQQSIVNSFGELKLFS